MKKILSFLLFLTVAASFAQAQSPRLTQFEALNSKAELLTEERDWTNAAMTYTEALKLYPDDVKTLLKLGIVHFYGKDYKKAIPVFTKLIALKSSERDAYFLRGMCTQQLGDKDEKKYDACKDFMRAKQMGYIADWQSLKAACPEL